LQAKAAATVKETSSSKELAEKVLEGKRVKKDFSSTYAETKSKELTLIAERFEWEKKNSAERFEWEKENEKEKEKAETRRTLILKLVEQQKSPDTIQKYLNALL
jgi:hypothetical protein